MDVVWFDAKSATSACDSALEERLSQQNSAFNWSVKNQARMHQRNGHQPYHSTENALLYWPETATAMAVRMGGTDHIEIIAPYGLDDLFELRLRPTPVFAQHKLAIFRQRVVENAGYSVIPACGFSSRHNAKPLFAWCSSKRQSAAVESATNGPASVRL